MIRGLQHCVIVEWAKPRRDGLPLADASFSPVWFCSPGEVNGEYGEEERNGNWASGFWVAFKGWYIAWLRKLETRFLRRIWTRITFRWRLSSFMVQMENLCVRGNI